MCRNMNNRLIVRGIIIMVVVWYTLCITVTLYLLDIYTDLYDGWDNDGTLNNTYTTSAYSHKNVSFTQGPVIAHFSVNNSTQKAI